MTEEKHNLSDIEVGERLRLARESAGIKQAEAAELIGAARTTVIAIEQGLRRVKIDELQKLAAAYGTSANTILRREAVHLDMIPRFRKLEKSENNAITHATNLLNDLVKAEVELENALGIYRTNNYPPERPLLPGDVRLQAEQDAQELRDWLGLGPGPIADIVSVMDLQIGIRVYVRRVDSKISGLFAFDDKVGACILLNACHPFHRFTQSAIHELGHFISTRRQAEVLTEDERFSSREERYADAFSRCFLMPARAVKQHFSEMTAGQSHLTRRHIILLSHIFGVSRETLVRRLEELSLAKVGTWDWFQSNGGITDEQAKQIVGELPEHPLGNMHAKSIVPPRLALLAREASKKSLYSEGQLARLLKLDRYEVRELLEGIENEEHEASELVKLPH
jgi:Zn-dependent peptidase ImmA (M78 family)